MHYQIKDCFHGVGGKKKQIQLFLKSNLYFFFSFICILVVPITPRTVRLLIGPVFLII